MSGLSYLCLEKYKRKNKSSQEDPGLVAWNPGMPDIVTHSPQGLDHSVLVETDNGQAAAEEAEGSPDFLHTHTEGSGQAPVFGPYVAHPLVILPGAQCHLHDPVPLARLQLPDLCSSPGPLCSHSHSPEVPH